MLALHTGGTWNENRDVKNGSVDTKKGRKTVEIFEIM